MAQQQPDDMVAGIDLGGSGLRAAIADSAGAIRARCETQIDPSAGPQALLAGAAGMVLTLVQRPGSPPCRLKALAIGTPGLVDAANGRVRSASNLAGWRDVPVRDILTTSLGVPVRLENDVNMAALGERAVGVALHWNNFVFVALGTGLGAGIIFNGTLLRGAHDAAGEIGYSCIDEERLASAFRADGRLEALIGGPALAHRARALPGVLGTTNADDLFAAARAGDAEAGELVQRTARQLGIAIGNLVAALDPEGVVLGGRIGSQPDLLETVRAVVARIAPAPVSVVTSGLGADAQLYGAIAAARELAGTGPSGSGA
jgi:glucokinase